MTPARVPEEDSGKELKWPYVVIILVILAAEFYAIRRDRASDKRIATYAETDTAYSYSYGDQGFVFMQIANYRNCRLPSSHTGWCDKRGYCSFATNPQLPVPPK